MEDREALIILAEMLDKARLQANAIEITAPQRGVYGNIADTLVEVLCLITGRFEVGDLYDSIMGDGNTVRQALAWVDEEQKYAASKPKMFDISSVKASDRTWERNGSLPGIGDDLRCIICNRPINPEGKGTYWVHMSEAWNAYPNGTPMDVVLSTEGDMGGHPIGSECAKKVPANYKEKGQS